MPSPMTMTEKILARHAGKDHVAPGENVWVDVDVLMTHDVCGPGTIGIFRREFGRQARVWDRDAVVLIPDHYIFTKDEKAHRNVDILREFAAEQGLPHLYDVGSDRYKGVCHVALAQEGHTRPGEVLFGTDSHTCTAGAFNQFATGIGNTDAAFVLGTGKLLLKVPRSAVRPLRLGPLPQVPQHVAPVVVARGQALAVFRYSRSIAHEPSKDLAALGIERTGAVPLDRIRLGRCIAFAFAGDHVQELRAAHLAQIAQRCDERIDIVPVDGADVVEAQFFENRAGKNHALHVLFRTPRQLPDGRHAAQDFLAALAQVRIELS